MNSMMDASSALHGWDEYPIAVFPELWRWLKRRIENNDISIIKANFEEVRHRNFECHEWLNKEAGIEVISPDDAITQMAYSLSDKLGIVGNKYHPKGINYNDLLLIATAYVRQSDIITNEEEQSDLPVNPARYKIPAVCAKACDPAIAIYSFREWFIDRNGNKPFTDC